MPVFGQGAVYLHSEWDDAQQMAIALRDVGANVPVLTQYGTTGIYLPLFDLNDLLVFAIQLPHSYQEFTALEPHVHWISDAIDANTVKWQMTYQWVNAESDVLAAVSSTTDGEEAPDVAGMTKLTALTTITKSDALISSLVLGNIKRVTNGGTDATANIYMAFFDLHFRKNTAGSRQEYIK